MSSLRALEASIATLLTSSMWPFEYSSTSSSSSLALAGALACSSVVLLAQRLCSVKASFLHISLVYDSNYMLRSPCRNS